jgi:aminopeptidase-like protein
MPISSMEERDAGRIYNFAAKLFPICRSLTGEGVRKTLSIIQEELNDLQIHEVPSGFQAFDWTVPMEWNISDAYIMDDSGKKIIDFKKCNLHVMGYSTPIDKEITFEELSSHLYSIPEMPDAIPYITSYFKENWGFCLSENQRKQLKKGNKYKVLLDSSLKPGFLNYGELILPGESDKEIFFSTYICHPSMANNEISGPSVTVELAQWIAAQKDRRHTYRIIFIPETLGSIVYLKKNIKEMKENIIAGFNVTCVGDDRTYSFLPSRTGETLADRAANYVLKYHFPEYKHYSFLKRGSDERQYCWPGIDLPVVSIMRSKYCEYPEYHTSLDNMDLITPKGLYGAFKALQKCVFLLENNYKYKVNCTCEPCLGKRGLYPQVSDKDIIKKVESMMNFIGYCDGNLDIIEIGEIINENIIELFPIIKKFKDFDLIQPV